MAAIDLTTMNPDDFTLGDWEDLETFGGISVEDFDEGNFTMRGLVALAWIVQRKENPACTLDDIRKLKFTDIKVQTATPKVDPTEAGEPAAS